MPLSPLVCRLAADLVPYRRRCAFSPSAFIYVGVGGFRRYPVYGELLSACLRTLLWGAQLRSFRPSGVPSCRFLLLYAILRLTLYRIATAALFLHPLSCTLALAASGVILSMKCSFVGTSILPLWSSLFQSRCCLSVCRDIVKKECALAWRMTCARALSARLRTLRWGARLRPFRLSGVSSCRFPPLVCCLAADLVPYCHRCAFSPSAFMYVGVGGFRRYPVHGELLSACLRTLLRGARLRPFRLSGVPSCRFLLLYAILRLTLCRIATAALFLHPLSCTLALAASGVILSMNVVCWRFYLAALEFSFQSPCHPSVAPRHCEKRMRAGRA